MARPKTYDDELRSTLIRIAAESIADGGERHMSLRPVTDAARTSTSAVYSFFGNKEGLVSAVLQEARASFVRCLESVPVTDDPLHDLESLALAYHGWVADNPSLYQVMFGGTVESIRDLEVGEWVLYDAALEPLRSQIRRLIERDDTESVPADLLVESIWAAIHGFISIDDALWKDDSPPGSRERFVAHLRAVLRGWLTPVCDHASATMAEPWVPVGGEPDGSRQSTCTTPPP